MVFPPPATIRDVAEIRYYPRTSIEPLEWTSIKPRGSRVIGLVINEVNRLKS